MFKKLCKRLFNICIILSLLLNCISFELVNANAHSFIIQAENYVDKSTSTVLSDGDSALYYPGNGWAVYEYQVPEDGIYNVEANLKVYAGEAANKTILTFATGASISGTFSAVKQALAHDLSEVSYTLKNFGYINLKQGEYLKITLNTATTYSKAYIDYISFTRVTAVDNGDLDVFFTNKFTATHDSSAGGSPSTANDSYYQVRTNHILTMNDPVVINKAGKYKIKIHAAPYANTSYLVNIGNVTVQSLTQSGSNSYVYVDFNVGDAILPVGEHTVTIKPTVASSNVVRIDYFTLEYLTEWDIQNGTGTIYTNSSTVIDYNLANTPGTTLEGSLGTDRIGFRPNNYASFSLKNPELAKYSMTLSVGSLQSHEFLISINGVEKLMSPTMEASTGRSVFKNEIIGDIWIPAGENTITIRAFIRDNDLINVQHFTLNKITTFNNSFLVEYKSLQFVEDQLPGNSVINATASLIKEADQPGVNNVIILAQYSKDKILLKTSVTTIDLSNAALGEATEVPAELVLEEGYDDGYVKVFIMEFNSLYPYCKAESLGE